MIIWDPKTKKATHIDCPPVRAAKQKDLVEATLAHLRNCKRAARRTVVRARALKELPPGDDRRRLFLEASRIELDAVSETVASLKGAAAKRRHLEAAISTLKSFELDDIQKDYIRSLEATLCAFEAREG